ncbi:YcbK family protein [Ferirhizobium litorale]|uniref:D-Ala-D-Ala carboxypeptidase family metallohydrolase n=1 Tax=Ferirhizobium litorale TaxID=2927786 RepID=A0AAE3U2W6_9HYPH|nr:D-Ala-D-Ala carboxypeptidase family metallohydrolase [Fererhizobium litorale]MDI7924549.1 D-Ala-D-Ala carboxypeptidase family metallohydrolase [Fererhizobium litorale]
MPYRRGLIVAASLVALSGCVSSVNELEISKAVSPASQTEGHEIATDNGDAGATDQRVAAANEDGGYSDPAVVTTADSSSAAGSSALPVGSAATAPADTAGLTMQPTTVNAGKTSIFAAQGAVASTSEGLQAVVPDQSADAPAFVPVPEINPALKSVYSAPEGGLQTQEGASATQPDGNPGVQSGQAIPATAPAPAGQASDVSNADGVSVADTKGNTESDHDTTGQKPLTLAAFFAGKRKARDKITDTGSNFAARSPRIVSQTTQVASSPPVMSDEEVGDLMPDNFLDDDEFDDGHAEAPEGLMELASLSGLTRIAPNGLMLQTPRVDVGCVKPELVQIIKSIETHYGRTAIVTSGYRETKRNRRVGGRRGSLHTTCEAADIQIPGVSKWELANYLRSRPDRGGVGTYCHTESVHLDLGPARDWNWRCRRKK